MVIDLRCSIRGLRRDSSNKTAVVPNFALYPCVVGVANSKRLKNIIWLKLCNALRKLLKLSLNTALRNNRNSISVLVELLCTLDSRLFSAGASRILVRALHARRLGRTKFPTRWTFFRDCVPSVNFARLIGLKTLCTSVVSMKTSAARRPEAFLTICHTFSTLPLNYSQCSLRLDCSPI